MQKSFYNKNIFKKKFDWVNNWLVIKLLFEVYLYKKIIINNIQKIIKLKFNFIVVYK